MKLGGGGQTSPGVQGNHYPRPKTPGFGPLFFGRDPSLLSKTNTNKNERLSESGGAPTASKLWGQIAPRPPPPPVPASLYVKQ